MLRFFSSRRKINVPLFAFFIQLLVTLHTGGRKSRDGSCISREAKISRERRSLMRKAHERSVGRAKLIGNCDPLGTLERQARRRLTNRQRKVYLINLFGYLFADKRQAFSVRRNTHSWSAQATCTLTLSPSNQQSTITSTLESKPVDSPTEV